MDPAQIQIPQRVDPSVDGKRLRCSAMPAGPLSKDADDTGSSPAPLDDENLLQEILLRVAPLPSALPRASLVCLRWRSILSDPQFLSRYRKHHRKPPLLGFFAGNTGTSYSFVPLPIMKPNRIPEERFSVPKSSSSYDHWYFLGCRHGLAVMVHDSGRVAVIWDPLTGRQHRVPFPPGLCNAKHEGLWLWHTAVLCADTEDGHVHGDCFSSPFRLILMCGGYTQAFACLYESISGAWGNIVSTVTTDAILRLRPSILIGNAVYWLFVRGDILAFDIETQTLGVIKKPEAAHHTNCYSFQLLRDDSYLGFAVMSKPSIQLWKRKSECDGALEWVLLQKTIHLEALFPQEMRIDHKKAEMVGYDEDSDVIILSTYIGDFMLQLKSMRFTRFSKRNCWSHKTHYPYRNFYTAGQRCTEELSGLQFLRLSTFCQEQRCLCPCGCKRAHAEFKQVQAFIGPLIEQI
ncbi:uncharacterized protein LOC125514893 isoform X2 [Triticum urartu]|uniref:uncharacterized protein LOC125514893 isoform X2 n=1 Tax=Triticum urartu TaxID=4572 RepID=UPI002043E387|nr:uncharacterized protein LOC125514893 isoform X2 [Triticum urartu]